MIAVIDGLTMLYRLMNGFKLFFNVFLFGFEQLFVAPDGGNGSNIEHSAADGVASAQVNAFALDNMYVSIF